MDIKELKEATLINESALVTSEMAPEIIRVVNNHLDKIGSNDQKIYITFNSLGIIFSGCFDHWIENITNSKLSTEDKKSLTHIFRHNVGSTISVLNNHLDESVKEALNKINKSST